MSEQGETPTRNQPGGLVRPSDFLPCPICGKLCNSRTALEVHIAQDHPASGPKPTAPVGPVPPVPPDLTGVVPDIIIPLVPHAIMEFQIRPDTDRRGLPTKGAVDESHTEGKQTTD